MVRADTTWIKLAHKHLQTPTYTPTFVCGRLQSNRYLPQTRTLGEVITIDNIRIQAAKQIRKLRQERHWTQQCLAEKCLLSGPWTVSRLETRGTDSLGMLEIVCKALGVEVWKLLKPDWEVPRDVTK